MSAHVTTVLLIAEKMPDVDWFLYDTLVRQTLGSAGVGQATWAQLKLFKRDPEVIDQCRRAATSQPGQVQPQASRGTAVERASTPGSAGQGYRGKQSGKGSGSSRGQQYQRDYCRRWNESHGAEFDPCGPHCREGEHRCGPNGCNGPHKFYNCPRKPSGQLVRFGQTKEIPPGASG